MAAPHRNDDKTGDEADRKVEASPLARRQRILLITAVVAAVAATTGLVASTLVKSPAQLAADTKAPPASLLTAPVVHEVLSTTLVMRGTFSTGREYRFTPTAVADSSHGPGGTTLIVTAMHTKVGAPVRAGEVLLEVSERPVYALPGRFPAYRDMRPGETGKDIAQLQVGLSRLGHPSRDRKGYFGASTKTAVQRFYKRIGYPVPLTAPEGDSDESDKSSEPGSANKTSRQGSPPRGAKPQPMVPKSEVAFLPTLPAKVAAVSAHVGDTVPERLIAFTGSGLTLTAKLDPARAELVKEDMKAKIVAETTGYQGTGTVESIGRRTTDTQGNDSGVAYIPLRIAPKTRWPDELRDEDVRVTITTASSKKAVLAVPEAAISSAADGRTTVTVVSADQTQRAVQVTAGVSADGMIEVTPASDGALKPGDRVVTGK